MPWPSQKEITSQNTELPINNCKNAAIFAGKCEDILHFFCETISTLDFTVLKDLTNTYFDLGLCYAGDALNN